MVLESRHFSTSRLAKSPQIFTFAFQLTARDVAVQVRSLHGHEDEAEQRQNHQVPHVHFAWVRIESRDPPNTFDSLPPKLFPPTFLKLLFIRSELKMKKKQKSFYRRECKNFRADPLTLRR
jgi:hypothetical protein